MLRDIMLYNYKWILRRRKKKRNYSWISFAIILLSSGIKLKSFGKIEMARFTPERSPRLALEDARLTFRATPCDAHVPIFFRTIAQTRGHRLTQPANSFEIHRSWKSLDRIQFAGREERKKEKKKSKEAATVLFDVSMDECRKKRGARNGTETCDELRVKSFWTSRPLKMNTDKRSREERLVSFACDTNNEAVSGLDGSLKLSIFRESGV